MVVKGKQGNLVIAGELPEMPVLFRRLSQSNGKRKHDYGNN